MSFFFTLFFIWRCETGCGTSMPAPWPHLCPRFLSLIHSSHHQKWQAASNSTKWKQLPHFLLPTEQVHQFGLRGRGRGFYCILFHPDSFLREAKVSLAVIGTWFSRQVSGHLKRHAPILEDDSEYTSRDHTSGSIFSLTQFKLKLQGKAAQGRAVGSHTLLLCFLLGQPL